MPRELNCLRIEHCWVLELLFLLSYDLFMGGACVLFIRLSENETFYLLEYCIVWSGFGFCCTALYIFRFSYQNLVAYLDACFSSWVAPKAYAIDRLGTIPTRTQETDITLTVTMNSKYRISDEAENSYNQLIVVPKVDRMLHARS